MVEKNAAPSDANQAGSAITRHLQMKHLIVQCIALGIALIDLANSAVVLAQQQPALSIRPHCQDRRSWWEGSNEGIESIDGVLTDEFFEAFKQALSYLGIKPHPIDPRHFSVAWGEELDPIVLVKSTLHAVDASISQRHGVRTDRDTRSQRARLPAPDFHPFDGFPTCSAIRKMALKGWEWGERGPPVTDLKPSPKP